MIVEFNALKKLPPLNFLEQRPLLSFKLGKKKGALKKKLMAVAASIHHQKLSVDKA